MTLCFQWITVDVSTVEALYDAIYSSLVPTAYASQRIP